MKLLPVINKPAYKNLQIFGCIAYAKIPLGNKLAQRSEKCIFIGYVPNGYKLWSLRHNRPTCARDVVFDETKMFKDLTNEEKFLIGTTKLVSNTTSQMNKEQILIVNIYLHLCLLIIYLCLTHGCVTSPELDTYVYLHGADGACAI